MDRCRGAVSFAVSISLSRISRNGFHRTSRRSWGRRLAIDYMDCRHSSRVRRGSSARVKTGRFRNFLRAMGLMSGGVYHYGWTVEFAHRKTGGSHDQTAIKLATLTMFSMALDRVRLHPFQPLLPEEAAIRLRPPYHRRRRRTPGPAPRSTSKSTSRAKKKTDKQSSLDDTAFRAGISHRPRDDLRSQRLCSARSNS